MKKYETLEKKGDFSEKVQCVATKKRLFRKKIAVNSTADSLISAYKAINELKLPYFLSLSFEQIGENSQYFLVRRYEQYNLTEFLDKHLKKATEKHRKQFIKRLFFVLSNVLFEIKTRIKLSQSIKMAPEAIFIDNEEKIFLGDCLYECGNEVITKSYPYQIAAIILSVIQTNTQEPPRVKLYKNKEFLPKGLYEILFICLEEQTQLILSVEEFCKMSKHYEKHEIYKKKAVEKEALENEAFLLRKGVVFQGRDLAILQDKVEEKEKMVQQAGEYFLELEKQLLNSTFKENRLVIQNRALENQVQYARRTHNQDVESILKENKDLKKQLKQIKETCIYEKIAANKPKNAIKNLNLKAKEGNIILLTCVENPLDMQTSLIAATYNNVLMHWDLLNHDYELFGRHDFSINEIAYNPSTNKIYTGSNDQKLRLWDVETKTCNSIIYGFQGAIYAISPLMNSQLLACSGESSRIHLYSEALNKMTCILDGHTASVWCLSSVLNEAALLSGSSDRQLRFWDLEAQKCVKVFTGHEKDIISIQKLKDDKLIGTCSLDNTIRLWDLSSGQSVGLFHEFNRGINQIIQLSQEKETLVGANELGLHVYELRNMKKIAEVFHKKGEKFYGGLTQVGNLDLISYGCGEDLMLVAGMRNYF